MKAEGTVAALNGEEPTCRAIDRIPAFDPVLSLSGFDCHCMLPGASGPASQQPAEIGRKYTNRQMPW
jgi:hypothetical protein